MYLIILIIIVNHNTNLINHYANTNTNRIYGGLLLFSGFVIYDTQIIIEQAHEGNRDFISHALSLFLDFVNIFIRVLIIIMKKGQRGGRDDRDGSSSLLPRFRKHGSDAFDL